MRLYDFSINSQPHVVDVDLQVGEMFAEITDDKVPLSIHSLGLR